MRLENEVQNIYFFFFQSLKKVSEGDGLQFYNFKTEVVTPL